MSKKLFAVIIGINAYPTMPLEGCLNDAIDVARYFEDICKKQGDLEWVPKFLLAPNEGDRHNIGELAALKTNQQPTKANIIAAFEHFKPAKDGDICLFYYSGHGSVVNAPKEFKGFVPGDLLQTVVCVDSRLNGAPDLLDKELGYLIATALEGKEPSETKQGVHFLCFVDCCHSGSISRDADTDAPVSRMATQGPPLSNVLGLDPKGNSFYKPFTDRINPNGGIRHARYINLSGARDSESAFELNMNMPDGKRLKRGVFTWSVLESLRQGGTELTYNELIRRTEMAVRARVDNQVPQLVATDTTDENMLFLQNSVKTNEHYAVMYEQGEWRMNAGSINGMRQPGSVKLSDGRTVTIAAVASTYCVLDMPPATVKEANTLTLTAKIHHMVQPETIIGYGSTMTDALRTQLEAAFSERRPKFGRIAKAGESPQLVVNILKNDQGQECYALNRPGSLTPLFMRTTSATSFWEDTGKILHCEYVLRLDNPQSSLPRNAVKVDIKTLEGQEVSPKTLATFDDSLYVPVPNQSVARPYPTEIHVKGMPKADGGIKQAAMKVKLTPNGRPIWVGALYCDAASGITSEFLKVQSIGGELEQPSVNLGFMHKGQSFDAIPLTIDKDWRTIGVGEICDHLIIFVSTAPFNLEKFNQTSVPLDTMRAAKFEDEAEAELDDWYTIKIPIRISIPKAQEQIVGGQQNTMTGGFMVTAPEGFSANMGMVNKKQMAGRNMPEIPPAGMFAGAETRPESFARGIGNAPDEHLNLIELTDVQGSIDQKNPLMLTPSDPLMADETIIPLAYDAKTGAYFPIGYTDDQGRIIIVEMPPAASNAPMTQPAEPGQKSATTAFRFYVQKLVWSKITGRPDINRLSLLDNDGMIAHIYRNNKDTDALAALQTAAQKGNVLLMIHGIIGDLENPLKFIQEHAAVRQHFGSILTYEYENLDTPIEETAAKLLQSLREVGIGDKQITIMAHSMGGLISRVIVEQLDGANLVQRLIQLGTPNAGSEVNDFREKMGGWLTLGINGLSQIKPYLGMVSKLWKGLGIDTSIFRTLAQMDPDSEFIAQLNAGERTNGIPYYLVAGNTSIIESSAGENEGFFKQLFTGLKERGLYILADFAIFGGKDPNDMAVKVKSMRAVPGGHVFATEVPCDHISYYSLKELEGILLAPSK